MIVIEKKPEFHKVITLEELSLDEHMLVIYKCGSASSPSGSYAKLIKLGGSGPGWGFTNLAYTASGFTYIRATREAAIKEAFKNRKVFAFNTMLSMMKFIIEHQ